MNHRQSLLAAHVAVFAMSITGVLAAVSGFSAWQVTTYRVVLGAAVLLLVLLGRREVLTMERRSVLACLGMGVWLSIHWYTFFLSMELLGLMLGYAMAGTQPLFIALMARLHLKERLSTQTLAALLISALGFVLLGSQAEAKQLGLGIAVALVSYAMFAVLVVYNRKYVQIASPLWVTTLEMLGAMPLCLWFTPKLWPSSGADWGYALLLGVACTGLAYLLYNSAMKVLSAPLAGLLLCLEVVYGLCGGVLLGDRLSPIEWVAVLLIANILAFDLVAFFRRDKTA